MKHLQLEFATMMLFFLVYAIILIIYWIKTVRMSAEQYPHVTPEVAAQWQRVRIINCRRYAGLFMIYVILLAIVTALYGYANKHHMIWLINICGYTEIGYFLFCLAFVMVSSIRTHRFAQSIGIRR
jgi:hypothetical protein